MAVARSKWRLAGYEKQRKDKEQLKKQEDKRESEKTDRGVWILGVARKATRVDRKKRKQRRGVRKGVAAQVSFLQPAGFFFTQFYYILRI